MLVAAVDILAVAVTTAAKQVLPSRPIWFAD
jgi:hypothetical protein